MSTIKGFLIQLLIGGAILSKILAALPPHAPAAQASAIPAAQKVQVSLPPIIATKIADVPFYSQFDDIQSTAWQGVGCGITSLAMLIDFYKPNAVTVNALLQQGISAGAYDQNAGWTYSGLIQLSGAYGLVGHYYDLSQLKVKAAFARFQKLLKSGPVMLSVHNRFDPDSTVPHLVVIDGIANNKVYYNDPAAKAGMKKISITAFLKGWTENVIAIRLPSKGAGNALTLK